VPGFVLDASVTLPWRFEDEATPWTESLLNRLEAGEEVLVPPHWPLEVANALLTAQRRRRVTSEQIHEFLDDLAALPIRIDSAYTPDQWPPVLALAERYHFTVYDAAYLELAQRTGLPLATLDADLRNAALAEPVALVETA
jgi:predicted nucleic acid-binding protein